MVIINSTPGVKKKYVDTVIVNLKTELEASIAASSTEITEATAGSIQVNKTGTGTSEDPFKYDLGLKTVFTGDVPAQTASVADTGAQYIPTVTLDAYGRVTALTSEAVAASVPSTADAKELASTTLVEGVETADSAKLTGVWATYDGKTQWVAPATRAAEITKSSDALVTASAVAEAIAAGVTAAYKVKGSKTATEIAAITDAAIGDVYNVSEAGSISILGTATVVPVGSNVVYTEQGWDKLSATVDLSTYATITEVNTAIGTLNDDVADLIDDVDALYSVKEDRHVRGSITITKIATVGDDDSVTLADGYTEGETGTIEVEIAADGTSITDGPYQYTIGTPTTDGSFAVDQAKNKVLVDTSNDIFITFSDVDIAYEAGLTVTSVAAGKFTLSVDFPECLTEDVTLSFVVMPGSVNTHNAIVGTTHTHPDTDDVEDRTDNPVA